jgi:hypothetical protein
MAKKGVSLDEAMDKMLDGAVPVHAASDSIEDAFTDKDEDDGTGIAPSPMGDGSEIIDAFADPEAVNTQSDIDQIGHVPDDMNVPDGTDTEMDSNRVPAVSYDDDLTMSLGIIQTTAASLVHSPVFNKEKSMSHLFDKASEALVSQMEEGKPIYEDPELALKAYTTIGKMSVTYMDSKRKLLDSLVKAHSIFNRPPVLPPDPSVPDSVDAPEQEAAAPVPPNPDTVKNSSFNVD